MANLPTHVVIVPDGNRRWAKQKNLPPWQGHFKGAEITKELLQTALDLDIYCMSIWGGSWENLTKRPRLEVKALFKIYEEYMKKLTRRPEITKYKIKVNVFGRWSEILPKGGQKAIRNIITATKNNDQHLLNFFIGYNGTDEMLSAIQSIARSAGKNKNLKITESILKQHLWTGSLPPVDLLIRTGSIDDPHNSAGFMMWQTANSQFYFSEKLYPDFDKQEFLKALKDFATRQRRLGK